MKKRLSFGNGENLFITTNGKFGKEERMEVASYMTTSEARRRINDQIEPREISEEKINAWKKQRGLFVFNMCKASSNLIDTLFKDSSNYVKKSIRYKARINKVKSP